PQELRAAAGRAQRPGAGSRARRVCGVARRRPGRVRPQLRLNVARGEKKAGSQGELRARGATARDRELEVGGNSRILAARKYLAGGLPAQATLRANASWALVRSHLLSRRTKGGGRHANPCFPRWRRRWQLPVSWLRKS